ncbi:MAG: response regulator [Gammaproteobacteria bacterium]|nr:response regulator [Gammaproteobacteria bacterium]
MAEYSDNPVVALQVEDDAQVSEWMSALLGSAGDITLSAADGPGALTLLDDPAVCLDVLIVDFHLPGDMDGTDTAEAVCRRLGYMVPTILLSADLGNACLPWMPGAPLCMLRKGADPQLLLHVVHSFGQLGRFIQSRLPAGCRPVRGPANAGARPGHRSPGVVAAGPR